MTVPFYEEKQTNPPWKGWILVLSGVGLLTFLAYLFIDRYEASGGQWNKELKGLLGAAAGTSIAIAVAAWLVFIHHLRVTISDDGIRYTLVPTFWKPRFIPASSILAFEIRKLGLWEFLQARGKHKHKSIRLVERKKEVCVIRGFTVADLALADGRHVILGTKNRDGLLWALKKLKGTE